MQTTFAAPPTPTPAAPARGPRRRAAPGRLPAPDLRLLQWLCAGHTNAQIAAHLCRSEKTVRNRLTRIYRTLGVVNRAQAVAVCIGRAAGPDLPGGPCAAAHTTGYTVGTLG